MNMFPFGIECTDKLCMIRSGLYITQVNRVNFQFIFTALGHEQYCHSRTIQSTSNKMNWYVFKAKNNLCYSKVLLTQNSQFMRHTEQLDYKTPLSVSLSVLLISN